MGSTELLTGEGDSLEHVVALGLRTEGSSTPQSLYALPKHCIFHFSPLSVPTTSLSSPEWPPTWIAGQPPVCVLHPASLHPVGSLASWSHPYPAQNLSVFPQLPYTHGLFQPPLLHRVGLKVQMHQNNDHVLLSVPANTRHNATSALLFPLSFTS